MYYYDWSYMLLLPAIIFTMYAQFKVQGNFKKYSNVRAMRGLTGAQAARRMLDAAGLHDVAIEPIRGSLTDHYDPRAQVLRLSQTVYGVNSVAAVSVACHEAGHAVQYAQNYAPIKLRAAIIPLTNLGSQLAMPLILIGLLLTAFSDISSFIVYLGIACFGLSLLFQLVTLPVEFNASRRAIAAIEQGGLLTEQEQVGAKRTLRAAAMTYVAATAVALAQLLRLIVLFGNRGKRRD
jgi:Zn-dependent membrane protease YugP